MISQEMAGQKELARHHPDRRIRNRQVNCICGWKTQTEGKAKQDKSFRRHQIREVLAAIEKAGESAGSGHEACRDTIATLTRERDEWEANEGESSRRATDAEARNAAIRHLHRSERHSWQELDGTHTSGDICAHCTDYGLINRVALFPCPTILAMEAEDMDRESQARSSENHESSEQHHLESPSIKAEFQSCHVPCAEPEMTVVLTGPECLVNKHRACDGRAFDLDIDEQAPCQCNCHP